MNLIEEKFHSCGLAFAFQNETVVAALEISICVTPEVVASESQVWLVLTDTRLLLLLIKSQKREVIREFRLDDIHDIEICHGDMVVIGLKITTQSIVEKIEGYILGKEKILEEIDSRIKKYLVDQRGLMSDHERLYKQSFIGKKIRAINSVLKTSVVFSLIMFAMVFSFKIIRTSKVMANDVPKDIQRRIVRKPGMITRKLKSQKPSKKKTRPLVVRKTHNEWHID